MPDPARIAIVLLSAIGDVVHALPLLASLRRAAPRSTIEWFVQPVPADLVTRHPAIDRTWIVERRRGWRGFRDLRRDLDGRRYDLVIDLQVSGKASLVTLLLSSPRKLGFDRRRAREMNWLVTNERLTPRSAQHVCEQYLEFADHLAAPRVYEWSLPIDAAERRRQRSFFERCSTPVAGLVIGTSRREKDWPLERWTRLAESLHYDFGYTVVLLGNARQRAERIVRGARCPIDNQQADDLRKLVWMLDGTALVVSPDTGPYHLSVALETPTVGLFGATDPARVGPNRRFLELVIDAFHEPGEGWFPPRAGFRPYGMARIEPRAVLDAVALARDRYPRAIHGPWREATDVPAA